MLDTTPAGDDVIVGRTIRDGADRTCDTGATGDDRQARRVGSVQPAVLEGFDDWANIVYQFRTTPNYANGIATPVPDEPDPEIIEEAKKLLEERIEPILTIEKASPATAFVGETIQYAISITNSGSGSAMDVRIVDTLPDGTQVVFEFDEIQAAANEILLVDFMVPLDTVPGTVLTNSVEVTYLDLLSNEKAASDSFDTTILNVVPSVDKPAVDIAPSDEGQIVVASAAFSDPAGSLDAPFVCAVDYGDGPVAGTVNGNLCTGPLHVYPDNGSYSITVAVTDKYGDTGSNNASHQVNNVPPTVNSIGVPLDPVDITDQALHTVDVTFSDPAGANDEPYTCNFDLDYDGTTFDSDVTASGISGNSCSTPLNYADPGVYNVKIKVIDKDGGASMAEAIQFIVVYDSNEGFVTGGGWIDSPVGAFMSDPLLTGKANFGFVSKYKKG
ncbi:MAG: PKD domain-containing protein, partial [Saprospiraceae bacterium]|nr:PKD domain-containing protein [Saprospiraceae bacterium]